MLAGAHFKKIQATIQQGTAQKKHFSNKST